MEIDHRSQRGVWAFVLIVRHTILVAVQQDLTPDFDRWRS